MPTLREQLDLIIDWLQHNPRESYGQECARELELMIRKRWPAERVYIIPPQSRKDPARSEAIRQAAKRLPTGVVKERFGVSRQLVSYHAKKR